MLRPHLRSGGEALGARSGRQQNHGGDKEKRSPSYIEKPSDSPNHENPRGYKDQDNDDLGCHRAHPSLACSSAIASSCALKLTPLTKAKAVMLLL